jgi:hypothetical protein
MEGTIMATKKLTVILFYILVISAWVLGSVIQVGAETMNFKFISQVTRSEVFPVGDVEGHTVGVQVREGAVILASGELAWMRAINSQDMLRGTPTITTTDQYYTVTFQDGSAITAHTRVRSETMPGKGGTGKWAGEITNGTGRFQGIKGTGAAEIKFIPPAKDELWPKALGEAAFNYTLPSK